MIALEPFDPYSVLLVALLNPLVIAVAFMMGRDADQWQKLIVAAFAASCAGFLLIYALAYVKFIAVKGFGAPTGVFVLQFLFALVWAWLGYRFWPKKSPSTN